MAMCVYSSCRVTKLKLNAGKVNYILSLITDDDPQVSVTQLTPFQDHPSIFYHLRVV